MKNGYLTIGEAAKIIGVANRTMSDIFDRGDVKGFRVPTGAGKDRRVSRKSLLEFAASRRLPMRDIVNQLGLLAVVFSDDREFESSVASALSCPGEYVGEARIERFPTLCEAAAQVGLLQHGLGLWIDLRTDRRDGVELARYANRLLKVGPVKIAVCEDETEREMLSTLGEVVEREQFIMGYLQC